MKQWPHLCLYIYLSFCLGSELTAQLHRRNRFNMSHCMTRLRRVFSSGSNTKYLNFNTMPPLQHELPTKTNMKVGQMPAIVFPLLWYSALLDSCQSDFSSVDLKLQEARLQIHVAIVKGCIGQKKKKKSTWS